MKITKEARRVARKLFRACLVEPHGQEPVAPAVQRNPPKLQSSFVPQSGTSEDTRIPPRPGGRGLLRRRVNHRLDEDRVRKTISAIVIQKPRYYLGILKVIEKLVRAESQKYTGVIESPLLLNENHFQEVYSRLKSSFDQPLTITQRVNLSLIGGLRIQVGSNVWDGSISARLKQLEVRN